MFSVQDRGPRSILFHLPPPEQTIPQWDQLLSTIEQPFPFSPWRCLLKGPQMEGDVKADVIDLYSTTGVRIVGQIFRCPEEVGKRGEGGGGGNRRSVSC